MIDHSDILQLCRLCLVEDKVNHSIFEEAGGLRGIFLKITSCLPVSISQDDSLPKKICDSCSSKLDTFYQFWNETANAEKQLLQWLNQTTLGPISKTGQTETKNKMDSAEVKEEAVDVGDGGFDDMKMSSDAQTYVLQQQQLPYSTPSKVRPAEENNETEESAPKRPRRASAMKALEHMGSEEEDDPDYDGDNYTKAESDDSEKDEDDDEDETYREGPSTSMDDQPGTSGMTKGSTETPYLPDVLIPIVQLKEVKEEEKELSSEEVAPRRRKYSRKVKNENGIAEKSVTKKGKIRVKPEFRMKLDDEDETYECPICKNDIKRTLKEMKLHYKSDHKGKRLRTSLLTNELHPCDICGKELRHKSALKEHMETHNNSYSCEECGINHKKPSDHVIHMRSHSEQGTFRCIFCDFNTTGLLDIQKHMSGDHERTQKFHCNICNKGFQIFSWFVEHENYHTGLKPFGCEFCGKCFLYSRYLSAHRNSMHKEELTGVPNIHECVICKKQYQHKNSLNLHMNSHTGNFAICDICGKILSSKEKLKFHLRTHTGYKPFSCSYCGKCFTKKPILVEHVRIHTGERPYVCEYCTKCFSQRSSLVIHIRSHTGERPYVCQFCQKGFVAKAMLNIHLRSCKGVPIN